MTESRQVRICRVSGWVLLGWIVGLLALYWLALVNLVNPHFRFTSVRLNFVVFTHGALIPVLCYVLALCFLSGRVRMLAATLLLPFLGTATVLLMYLSATLPEVMKTGVNPGFTHLITVPVSDYQVGAYRSSQGAFGGTAIFLWQQKKVLPGLIRVRTLYVKGKAADVEIKILDDHRIRCVFPPYGKHRRIPSEIVLTLEEDF